MKNESYTPKKSLGQHFLTSEGALADILRAADVQTNDTILEIGPGKGVLTENLLGEGAEVVAVEKDRALVGLLQEKFASAIKKGKLTLIEGDILDFTLENLPDTYKLVANIPYNITGEILRKFLTNEHKPLSMTLLIQKEVAERIIAKDGKESVLSLSVKFFGTPSYISLVRRGSFFPPPKVDSAIINIQTHHPVHEIGEEDFFKAIKEGFKSKRKKLISNLSPLYEKKKLSEAFENLTLDKNMRAEDVNLELWLKLLKLLRS